MNESEQAIAAAREIHNQSEATIEALYRVHGPFKYEQIMLERTASIIQKHYVAKDAEIEQLKIDITEIRRQHQQEASEWKTDEELTARAAGLEKVLKVIVDEAWGISQKALAATNPKALTRLQELERKAKALDLLARHEVQMEVFGNCCNDLIAVIEKMEKQK